MLGAAGGGEPPIDVGLGAVAEAAVMGSEVEQERGGLAQLASGVDVAIRADRCAFRSGTEVPEKFLTYVSPRGRALIDRELHLPVSWTEDRERCAEAGIPVTSGNKSEGTDSGGGTESEREGF